MKRFFIIYEIIGLMIMATFIWWLCSHSISVNYLGLWEK